MHVAAGGVSGWKAVLCTPAVVRTIGFASASDDVVRYSKLVYVSTQKIRLVRQSWCLPDTLFLADFLIYLSCSSLCAGGMQYYLLLSTLIGI